MYQVTNDMIRIHFEITPCRTSLDSNIYLLSVQRAFKDLAHKPALDEFEKHKDVKAKRSQFISIRSAKLSKLDRTLLENLMRIGELTYDAAVNVLLACKREVAAGYCDPTNGETKVRFYADRACFGDNLVDIVINVKGRKEMPEVA